MKGLYAIFVRAANFAERKKLKPGGFCRSFHTAASLFSIIVTLNSTVNQSSLMLCYVSSLLARVYKSQTLTLLDMSDNLPRSLSVHALLVQYAFCRSRGRF